MATFTVKADIRWSDIDPNFHVLHSKYYDYCANARLIVLAHSGITMQVIQEEKSDQELLMRRFHQPESEYVRMY